MVAVCVDAGFRPRIVQEVSDTYVVLSLLAAGVGSGRGAGAQWPRWRISARGGYLTAVRRRNKLFVNGHP
jgi:hypothetical protein